MKTNKGYTLIEMMIVIAIMAILTGVAFVTLSIIKEAKCTSAIETFQNEVSSLWIKTKAISQGKTQTTPVDSSSMQSKYPLCMLVKKNTDSSDDIRDGSYQIILGYQDGSTFTEKESASTLPDIVSIRYAGKAEQLHPTLTGGDGDTAESILIEFNKSDGSVKYGAGTYEFIYNNQVVGTVYLDAVTGNHYIK